MLPTGHIAAGYLTAYGVIKIFKPELDQHQLNQLLAAGAFAGFAPDLDEFWFFFKNRTLLVAPGNVKKYHRDYFTHAPILWLVAAAIAYLSSADEIVRLGVLIFFLASLSHFVLDSIEHGIMWLWPFTSKFYALKSAGEKLFVIEERNFFRHSFKFLWYYAKTVSFYLEIAIIIAALIIYFIHFY